MAEYIYEIESHEDNGSEIFIGWIRNHSQELIRCKDCKYSSPNQVYGCRIHSFADDLDKRMYSDDFCSMAERKKE